MSSLPSYRTLHTSGELHKRTSVLHEMLKDCRLCPRQCRVNRLQGERGFCRAGRELMISSAFPHFGEEAPLVGTGGSGTIFLTHCNLRCIFCQTHDISHLGQGEAVTSQQMAAYMVALQQRGCHNINLTGGTPVRVTHLDTTRVDASHRFPVWLPNRKHFLFALWSNNPRVRSESGGIHLASVEGGTPTHVTPDMGEFLVLPSGHLVTVRNSGLVAIPFDLRTFRAGTDAIPIADDVRLDAFAGFLAAGASATGDIAFESAASVPPTDMAWLDQSGHRGQALGLRAGFDAITLSPDGARVVGTMVDATGLWQLWTADLARRTTSPLSRGQNDTYSPVWSPDGQRIAFANGRHEHRRSLRHFNK